jgi:predicted phage tail protein
VENTAAIHSILKKKITKRNFKPGQYLKSKINKNYFEKKINAKKIGKLKKNNFEKKKKKKPKNKKGKSWEKMQKKKKKECIVDYSCNP